MANPENRPDYTDAYHNIMAPVWQTVADVTVGAPALRTETYLPKHALEHDKDHELRVKLADWTPFFDETVQAVVGLIFRDEPVLGEDVPEFIQGVEANKEKGIVAKEGLWENLDYCGTHGNVFLAKATDDAARYGHCVLVVEAPPRLGPDADLGQQRSMGRRPYVVKYLPEQVRNPFFINENGRLVLQQITFCEVTKERHGLYGKKDVTRYRTFIRAYEEVSGQMQPRVRWIVEREIEDENGKGKGEFYVEDEGATGLDEIPYAVIYGNKTGNLESRPPFENLMYLNLSHWRKTSDRNFSLSRLQWCLLVAVGADEGSIKLGKDGIIYAPTGGDAKYVAPPADSAQVSADDLDRIEKTAASFGLRVLLEEPGGNKTAEEVKTDHATKTSKISTIVKSVKDAAERVLYFMALYNAAPNEKVTTGGSITVGGDVDGLALSSQELDTLLRAVESGNFRRADWLQLVASMIQKQIPDFDAKAADKELQGMEESINASIRKEEETARQGNPMDR